MPQTRESLERQLEAANTRKSAREAELGDTAPKKDPVWRSLDADVRALTFRLKAVTAKESLAVTSDE